MNPRATQDQGVLDAEVGELEDRDDDDALDELAEAAKALGVDASLLYDPVDGEHFDVS